MVADTVLDNFILDTDSYKFSHYCQYPQVTTYIHDYIESRGGKFPQTVFFGLQYILKRYFTVRITPEMVEDAREIAAIHGEPFPYDGWMYIAKELGGKLPIRIQAVPEGTVVPTHHVLVVVESTDEKVPWVVSWAETQLMRLWYPTTVATLSYHCKKNILHYLDKSSDDPQSEILFKLHDFGGRGVTCREQAGIGGLSHLVNFQGTDTLQAVVFGRKFYNCSMAGFSIPAAEHSTITSWGPAGEMHAYKNMLDQFGGKFPLIAVVSDSYSLWNAVDVLWGDVLRQKVIDSGSTIIIRPDSGDPTTVVRETLIRLDRKFGSTINSKGYKVLNHVRVIQGDGINYDSISEILDGVLGAGFSATNVAFGMGGGLLQSEVNRDTQKFAMKCSAVTVNGEMRDVFKDPITDPGKRSKKGRLELVRGLGTGEYRTIRLEDEIKHNEIRMLQTVYENGELLVDQSLDDIRKRAWG